MSAPDLERAAADGYRVAAYFRPNLRAPASATVIVTRYGRAVDCLTVEPARALETYRHAGALLPAYRHALTIGAA